eukprot:4843945-Pyramimonas_sp.AAC.4
MQEARVYSHDGPIGRAVTCVLKRRGYVRPRMALSSGSCATIIIISIISIRLKWVDKYTVRASKSSVAAPFGSTEE